MARDRYNLLPVLRTKKNFLGTSLVPRRCVDFLSRIKVISTPSTLVPPLVVSLIVFLYIYIYIYIYISLIYIYIYFFLFSFFKTTPYLLYICRQIPHVKLNFQQSSMAVCCHNRTESCCKRLENACCKPMPL